MVGILKPSVKLLSRRPSMSIARAIGIAASLTPVGVSTYWSMRLGFRLSRWEAFRTSADYHALIFEDYVVTRRLIEGKKDFDHSPVREYNFETLASLLAAGESVIIVCGHFARSAFALMCYRLNATTDIVHVGKELPRPSGSISSRIEYLRLRAQYGSMLEAYKARTRPGSVDFVEVGAAGKNPMLELYKKMKNPDRAKVCFIFIDAPWHATANSALRRPFVANKEMFFALGTTRLARGTGCPIVTCFPWIADDGTVVIEWGEPVRIDRDDEDAEERIINQFLDQIEKQVGERPSQYVLPIGMGRVWDKRKKQWTEVSD